VVFGGLSVYFLFIKNKKPPGHKKEENIYLFTTLKKFIWRNSFLQGVSEMLGQTSEVISRAQTRKKDFINIRQKVLSFVCSPATL
jgi:hypothetical protein